MTLAKWSPVLEAMLRSDCRETQQGEIEIRGHDDITVKTFIKYLYQGSLDPKRYTLELLRIADQYQVLHIQVSNVKSQAIVHSFEIGQPFNVRLIFGTRFWSCRNLEF